MLKLLPVYTCVFLAALIVSLPVNISAQTGGQQLSPETAVDRLSYSYGWQTGAGAGTSGELPFWIYSNRYGQIDRQSANGLFSLFGLGEYDLGSGFSAAVKADLLFRTSDRSNIHFNEGFVQLSYGYFELWAGRKREQFGLIHPTLSTGSMDLSENARPIPQIVFATRGFMPVPYTDGILHFDASLGHGWQTDRSDRFVDGLVRIHRKHLYLRIFDENAPLVLHGGLKHFAQWGGTSQLHGSSPVNFRSFLDVFFSRAADSNEIIGGGQLLNSAQNHIGTYDFAIKVNTERYIFSLSRQFILEDTPNARFGTPWDGMWGATISLREPGLPRSWKSAGSNPRPAAGAQGSRLHQSRSGSGFRPLLQTIHYEYIDLKEGMSRFPQRARDEYFNYYNHWAYRGGWTYFGQSLGNPLLLTDPLYLGVVNNEIIAHHLGLEGFWGAFDWRFLSTYSRNYGANRASRRTNPTGRENLLTERRDQWSFLLDVGTKQFFKNTEARISFGFDTGEVHPQNFGTLLTLRWTAGS
ncbi:MAG: capsule assembly Wzi family protein [Candidatus Cyclonatronum sp.]|uniref:capsule assembly Wzi family protein n=1 Tax=Cyclonatronum sp. TaxID=3024185 RepID=UPI0025BAB54D|nr:capsule assembly Wzi family protein [Cyclonatronum sp.]MCH8485359.1 capsule assembly Wzi family protein [Cyclonatronum sp.]